MSGRMKRKIIGNPVGTTLNPAMLGGGGGGEGGPSMIISASKPLVNNCVWFNTSGVIPADDATVLTLTDNTDGGIIAEVNGETYGVGNIKEEDDPSTKEYDYTLI